MSRWVGGNSFDLLENGEEFYPAVFEAIAGARSRVLVETFILFEDKIGLALRDALVAAARAGAEVDLTYDGFGSAALTPEFLAPLAEAGGRAHVFDPMGGIFSRRTNLLRRMHRKIVVVDGAVAFVGGINYSADHVGDFGPESKQDYAARIRGPLVSEIEAFAIRELAAGRRSAALRREGWIARLRGGLADVGARARGLALPKPEEPTGQPADGGAWGLLAVRDNRRHRHGIERGYRAAIRSARERVVIANAYFFPGYRLIRELRRAAKRGVDVRLVLQGKPDMPIVRFGARLLHDHLLSAGVRIFEYRERPLHGKVALVDDFWSTVGSSNLDPLSLSLNLEANVVIRDQAFNAALSGKLSRLIAESCDEVERDPAARSSWWTGARNAVVFHVLRRYPDWVGLLPRHAPILRAARPSEPAGSP